MHRLDVYCNRDRNRGCLHALIMGTATVSPPYGTHVSDGPCEGCCEEPVCACVSPSPYPTTVTVSGGPITVMSNFANCDTDTAMADSTTNPWDGTLHGNVSPLECVWRGDATKNSWEGKAINNNPIQQLSLDAPNCRWTLSIQYSGIGEWRGYKTSGGPTGVYARACTGMEPPTLTIT